MAGIKSDKDMWPLFERHIKPWTFAIHFHTANLRMQNFSIHTNQPLYKIMEKYCPLTFMNEVKPNVGGGWKFEK